MFRRRETPPMGLSGARTGRTKAARPQLATSVHRTGGLNHRGPARDLAPDQRGEGSRAALALVRQDAAELQEPFARVVVVERLVDCVGELIEDRLGCGFG